MQTSVAHSLSLLEGCMNCCWHYGPKSVIKLSTVAVLSVELLVNCSAESLFLKSLSTHQIAALILQKESFCSHTSYSGYFSTMEEKKSLLSLLWCEMGIHFAKKISASAIKAWAEILSTGLLKWTWAVCTVNTNRSREREKWTHRAAYLPGWKGSFFLPKGWCSEAKMTASENRVCGINTVRIFPQ